MLQHTLDCYTSQVETAERFSPVGYVHETPAPSVPFEQIEHHYQPFAVWHNDGTVRAYAGIVWACDALDAGCVARTEFGPGSYLVQDVITRRTLVRYA